MWKREQEAFFQLPELHWNVFGNLKRVRNGALYATNYQELNIQVALPKRVKEKAENS